MGTFKKYEDIESWQLSVKLVTDIYALTKTEALSKDFALRDQIRRSAISIPSNIAEGFERGGNKEFIQFLYIAKGSAAELQTQILIALNLNYIPNELYNTINSSITNISKLISGLIKYLKTSEFKGEKYKI